MKRFLLSLFVLIGLSAVSYAQHDLKENSIWMPFVHAGLDFNGGAPVVVSSAITSGSNNFQSAYASLSDRNGNLLFYTNSDSVWNRNHQVMPNGYDLPKPDNLGNGSVILPVVSSSSKFYLFSLSQGIFGSGNTPGSYRKLTYSVIDMTLDNGLGDIVPGMKNITVDSNLSGLITAIPGDNCNIWLVVHDNADTLFKAYEIGVSGINPVPVLSHIGLMLSDPLFGCFGNMAASPDGHRIIAYEVADFFNANGLVLTRSLELYGFDPVTGLLSDRLLLDSFTLDPTSTVLKGDYGGSCFSPDNSKLYVPQGNPNLNATSWVTSVIHQYDLTSPVAADILNSRITLPDSIRGITNSYCRLAPDGKIYMPAIRRFGALPPGDTVEYIGTIAQPDLAGIACGFIPRAIALPYSATEEVLLGETIGTDYIKPAQHLVQTLTDTTISVSDSLIVHIPSGYFTYQWNDGSTDSVRALKSEGSYSIRYSNYCMDEVDSFIIRHPSTSVATLDNLSGALVVYPVPAQRGVTVRVDGYAYTSGSIALFDVSGRMLWKRDFNTGSAVVDISSLANGIYTIVFSDNAAPAFRLQSRIVIAR